MPRYVSSILITTEKSPSHLLHCQTSICSYAWVHVTESQENGFDCRGQYSFILMMQLKVISLPDPYISLSLFFSISPSFCSYFVSAGLRLQHVPYFLNFFGPEKRSFVYYYILYLFILTFI